MKKIIISLCFSALLVGFSGKIEAQEKDPVLMKMGGKEIPLSEFIHIYTKNNPNQSKDEKSLNEYLDLFVNFNLKVKEAEALGYDTSPAFINELAGYRRQLAQPYLTDNEVSEQLLKESYDRLQQEINASHILIKLDENALPKDTLAAWNKIMKLRERVIKGEDFGKVAESHSEDPSAKENQGQLGFFTAFQMVYPFENMAYNTEVGQVSMPVRTRFGYHLVNVLEKRPARGQVLVAHIMIETPKEISLEDSAAAYNKIQEIFRKVNAGEDFGQLAQQFSDDRGSARRGGELPWFGTGRMVPEFENVAFSLNKAETSQPFRTRFGWHIIKQIDKKEMISFDEMKAELKAKVSKDSRSQLSRTALINRIKSEYGYKENLKSRDEFVRLIDNSFFEGTWSASRATGLTKPVLTIGSKTYTQADFANYLENQQSKRSEASPLAVLNSLFTSFAEEKVIAYEDAQLENKFPEFKALMNEYRKGILLFELTDKMVWSKAVNDTAGLEAFYEQNKNNFMWGERLNATVYITANDNVAKQTRKLVAQAKKKGLSSDDISRMINQDSQLNLKIEKGKYQKGENEIIDNIKWVPGITPNIKKDNKVIFVEVHEKINPQTKSLREAKGLITAEYQSHLEKLWIEELKAKYPVEVYPEVLKNIK
jgi:peptidyl-prolyl cis-trans isomerase SurA